MEQCYHKRCIVIASNSTATVVALICRNFAKKNLQRINASPHSAELVILRSDNSRRRIAVVVCCVAASEQPDHLSATNWFNVKANTYYPYIRAIFTSR